MSIDGISRTGSVVPLGLGRAIRLWYRYDRSPGDAPQEEGNEKQQSGTGFRFHHITGPP